MRCIGRGENSYIIISICLRGPRPHSRTVRWRLVVLRTSDPVYHDVYMAIGTRRRGRAEAPTVRIVRSRSDGGVLIVVVVVEAAAVFVAVFGSNFTFCGSFAKV